MTRVKNIVLLILISVTYTLYAQSDYSTSSKKAIKHYEEAIKFYNAYNNEEVINELNIALKADSKFVEAYLLMAEVYTDQKKYDQIIASYKKAIATDSSFFPPAYLNLGNTQLIIGKYEDALKNFISFLNFKNIKLKLKESAIRQSNTCQFAIEAIKNPVPFEMVRLSDSINTAYNEYWPSLTADGKTLVFTSLIELPEHMKNKSEKYHEDFFVSELKDGIWTKAVRLDPPLNTLDNEGAQAISVDGKIMYFTACNRTDGVGRCDIYVSRKVKGEWSKGINIGTPVNSKSRESQPSISPDGKILYFASNRSGGYGQMDIWKSKLIDENKWSNPENMGDIINTSGNEISPFIHPDNKTLYFSSDGKKGMGQSDLYMCKVINDSVWSEPVNLGYPINTYRDEIGLIVNAEGNKAYFASNRIDISNTDLYEFELYSEIRPDPVSYMKGIVFNADTKNTLQANIELIDVNSNNTVMEALSDKSGEFLLCLPTKKNYALNISKKGYMFFSEHFSLKDAHDKLNPYLMDIYLHPIKSGEKVVLKNIFYETDSYELKNESTAELEKMVQFLNENRELKIEISGHTDNIGTTAYNLALSKNRAKSVIEYLSKQLINPERLSYKGYGETQAVAPNSTEEGRTLNRRTELLIISL